MRTKKSADPKPIAFAREEGQRSESLIVRFRNKRGRYVEMQIPASVFGDSKPHRLFGLLAELLYEVPASSSKRQRIFNRLNAAKPRRYITYVKRLGWHGSQFQYGKETIGPADREYRLALSVRPFAKRLTKRGSLRRWQQQIGRHCRGNSRLIFAVSLAFGAVLLKLLNGEGTIFHLVGPRRCGKSTAARVAFSVIGGTGDRDGGLISWDATLVGLEALCSLLCDLILCIDEMSQVDEKAMGKVIMKLADQLKRIRGLPDGSLAPSTAPTRLIVFSNGNKTAKQIGLIDKRLDPDAAAVRLQEIPAMPHDGKGIFERVPKRFRDGDDARAARNFADHLNQAVTQSYGAPIRRFLIRYTETGTKEVRESAEILQRRFTNEVAREEADRAALNIMQRWSCLFAGGALAARWGILPLTEKQVLWGIKQCYLDSLDPELMQKNLPPVQSSTTAKDIVDAVRRYIRENYSRILVLDRDSDHSLEKLKTAVGFRDPRDKRAKYLLLKPDLLRSALEGICKQREIATALEAAGLLVRGADGRSCAQSKVGELGKLDFYKLRDELG